MCVRVCVCVCVCVQVCVCKERIYNGFSIPQKEQGYALLNNSCQSRVIHAGCNGLSGRPTDVDPDHRSVPTAAASVGLPENLHIPNRWCSSTFSHIEVWMGEIRVDSNGEKPGEDSLFLRYVQRVSVFLPVHLFA